jgi:hypothetical protein
MRYKTRGLLNRFSKACEHSRFDNSWDEDCRWGERQHEGHKRTKTAKAPLVFCAICSFGPFVGLSSSAIKLFSTVASAQFNFPAQGFSIHNRVGFAQRFGWRGIAQIACFRAHLFI